LTQKIKIVIDLNSLEAKESLKPLGRFSLQLAAVLAQESSANNYRLYILIKADEQSSNLWLRDYFSALLPKEQILCWSIPRGLRAVCDEVDLGLRIVSEHIREAVLAQAQPDLVVVTDLFCGYTDQSCASVGLMNDRVPTAVCLPSDEVQLYDDSDDQSQTTRQWYQTKLLQLKRAHYWLSINDISQPAGTDRLSLPPEKIYELGAAEVDNASHAVLAILNLAEKGRQANTYNHISVQKRARLAYLSPLPPEHTGIASYSAELLPELAKYYDVDVIVDQDTIVNPWIHANAGIYSVAWFMKYGHQYDRILYQIGNSPFHAHMWDLLERFPGVVVLHDLFLGDATYYRSEHGTDPLLGLPMRLYADHGYGALADFSRTKDIQTAIQDYPYSLNLIQAALGVVVHSTHAKALAAQRYTRQLAEKFSVIPHLRVLPPTIDKLAARKTLGIGQDVFLVCSFGHIVSNKMYAELIQAWITSPLAEDQNCILVLVGASIGEYGEALNKQISESDFRQRISITGWADDATFKAFLYAADLAVQLRKESRGESSGSVLDCMAVGLPTICNAHGSMAELPSDGIWQLQDEFKVEELVAALTKLWLEPLERKKIGLASRLAVQKSFAPWRCAELYRDSIEAFYSQPTQGRNDLIKSLVNKLPALGDLSPITEALERSLPNARTERQLLVDITALVQTDLHTGIQRVARSVLKCLLENPPQGYRVEPVYTAFGAQGYFYARQFTKKFLQIDIDILADDPVLMLSEDVFLGLDLCLSDVFEQRQWFEQAQQRGALVYFLAYDLLPVTHPHWFPASEQPIFEKWLQTIKESDGVISISKSTSDDLKRWMREHPRRRECSFRFGVAHIGADIEQSMPSKGLPKEATETLAHLKNQVTFLMVGTIEPRKGHAQAIAAFEHLWKAGHGCQLVIVGKAGWNVEPLIASLQRHPELGAKLFWFESVSDEYLELLYEASNCLLMASEAEGFGLPIIEAAKHKLAILARDISVFREVAKRNANYFKATNELELSQALIKWLQLHEQKKTANASKLKYLTWRESTRLISDFVCEQPH
jgi:glycosyltransferase involved in cell wall biosynthesis